MSAVAGGWDEDRQSAEAATQIGQRERERQKERGIFLDAEGPKIIGEKMNRTPPRRETGENCNGRKNEFPPGLISGTETEREGR